ncbi:MAG TPA: hypothetical protein VGM59_01130 [Dongiaceae bacterium]
MSASNKAKARKVTAEAITQPAIAAAEPMVANLAAHRALRGHTAPHPAATEIYGMVEWIGPARDDWRRGELEVHRSACVPMTATRNGDGGMTLAEVPGHGAARSITSETLAALASGALPKLVLTLPGLRITFTAAELLGSLPALPKPAQVLAFPTRRSA